MNWIQKGAQQLKQLRQRFQSKNRATNKASSKAVKREAPKRQAVAKNKTAQTMSSPAKKAAVQAGHTALKKGLTSDQKYSSTGTKTGNTENRQSKEVQKDKPLPQYTPTRPMTTPNKQKSQSKGKGRSL